MPLPEGSEELLNAWKKEQIQNRLAIICLLFSISLIFGGWIGAGFPKPSLFEVIVVVIPVLGLSAALYRTYFSKAARAYRRIVRHQKKWHID
jgi:fumarate reductase subunit C